MVECSATSWRFRLLSLTVSWSMRASCPTPARPRPRSTSCPRPPGQRWPPFAGKCFNGFLPQQQGRPFKLAHVFPSLEAGQLLLADIPPDKSQHGIAANEPGKDAFIVGFAQGGQVQVGADDGGPSLGHPVIDDLVQHRLAVRRGKFRPPGRPGSAGRRRDLPHGGQVIRPGLPVKAHSFKPVNERLRRVVADLISSGGHLHGNAGGKIGFAQSRPPHKQQIPAASAKIRGIAAAPVQDISHGLRGERPPASAASP